MNEIIFVIVLLFFVVFSFLVIFSFKKPISTPKDRGLHSKYVKGRFQSFNRFILNSLKIFLFSIVCIYIISCGYEYFWYRGCIPKEIGVTFPVGISGKSGFREGCGAAVFLLSSSTNELIEKQGIDFFTNVKHARKSNKHYYTYATWSKTPVPESWISEGCWLGLGCWNPIISLFMPVRKKIIDAAKKKGSYYSTKPEGEILIIPELKLVVFSYYG